MAGEPAEFTVKIVSNEPSYDAYDKLVSQSTQVTYIPGYDFTGPNPVTHFNILRLLPVGNINGSSQDRVIIEYHPSNGGPSQVIFDESLIDLIRSMTEYKNADFDRLHVYNLTITFDITYETGTINVNKWEIADGGNHVIG